MFNQTLYHDDIKENIIYPFSLISEYIPFSALFETITSEAYPRTRVRLYLQEPRRSMDLEVNIIRVKIWIDSKHLYFPDKDWSSQRLNKLYDICVNKGYTFQKNRFPKSRTCGDYLWFTSGYYSLFDVDSKPLFVLMVKKSHVRYVKLCLLSDKVMLEDCFEFWYVENQENAKIKILQSKLLKELKSKDIPCISFDSVDSLYAKISYSISVKSKSIMEQKQKLFDLSLEYKNHLKNV